MKKYIVGILVSTMCLNIGMFNSFAKVDEYGNEIEWDINGIGGEDSAGGEVNYVPINADQLETEREVMTPGESEAIQEIVASTEQSVETEKGIITATFLPPDNWRGNNVVLIIYPLDANGLPRATEKKSIYIYKQNNYIAREELDVGEYQVYQASVVGDKGQVFPMLTSVSEFTVEEGGAVVNVDIELAGSNSYKVENSSQLSKDETSDVVVPDPDEVQKEDVFVTFLKDNVIFLILGSVLGAVYLVCKKRGER